MKKKCSICQKVSCGHVFRESFVCEDCLDYIRGLSDIKNPAEETKR